MRSDTNPNIYGKNKNPKFSNNDKRGRIKTSTDPYIDDAGMPEPCKCEGCGAVYLHKRWYSDAETASFDGREITRTVTCPGCRKVRDGYAEGYVSLSGDYLWQHEEEIRNIIKNEEKKARSKNPLEQIIFIERQGDDLLIETTEEKLAEHLGRAINKAHQGDLNVTWTDDHAICRVTWSRTH